MKKLSALLLAVLLFCCLALAGCTAPPDDSEPEIVGGSTRREPVVSEELQFVWPADNSVFATLETGRGTIRLVLYPDEAPLAVENFCTLAQQGYYDGTSFHRIVEDFIIQGGDATGTGKGGASIWGRVYHTEISDKLHHYAGAVCAAPVNGERDSHASQFYIVATPQSSVSEASLANLQNSGMRQAVIEAYRQAGGAPYLDYTDTVFGQVIEGMDVVDTIVKMGVEEDTDTPKNPVLVEKVTIQNWPSDAQAESVPESEAPEEKAEDDG